MLLGNTLLGALSGCPILCTLRIEAILQDNCKLPRRHVNQILDILNSYIAQGELLLQYLLHKGKEAGTTETVELWCLRPPCLFPPSRKLDCQATVQTAAHYAAIHHKHLALER